MLTSKHVFLILLVFFSFNTKTVGQTGYKEEDILLELDRFLDKYRELSNFGPEKTKARTQYTLEFISIFDASYHPIIMNDLPQLIKDKTILSPVEYSNLLFDEFQEGLIADVIYDSVKISKTEINTWEAEAYISKTIYGSHEISVDNITHALKIDLLFDEEFKIIQISVLNDTDLDGINDSIDLCPDEYGFHKFDGCPDSDFDGVPDYKDRCPNTLEGIEVNKYGCKKYYYADEGFMEIDFCPTLTFSKIENIESNKKVSAKPINDNKGQFNLSYKTSLNLVKALAGNYNGSIIALKAGTGFYNHSFYLYGDTENETFNFPYKEDYFSADYDKNTLKYVFISTGLRGYNLNKNVYAGGGFYFFELVKNKNTLRNYEERNASLVQYPTNDYRTNALAKYIEIGYKTKISQYTYLNFGLELIVFDKFKNDKNRGNIYGNNPRLINSIEKLSQNILSIRTAIMFDLTERK
jgi:hypothetical protein